MGAVVQVFLKKLLRSDNMSYKWKKKPGLYCCRRYVSICVWSVCGLCGWCDWELEVGCRGLIHADRLSTCLDIPDPARSTSK